MSLLKFFSGPAPEKLEQKGDAFFDSGLWGEAKLEYERALAKAKKERRMSADWEMRLFEKIARAKESLAAAHQKTAEDLMEGGYFNDARPLLSLALEITANQGRARSLRALAEKLETLQQAEAGESLAEAYYGLMDEQTPA